MKQYRVLANSITTHLSAKYAKGDVVNETEFSDVAELVAKKAIEEVKEEKPAKNKTNETV